MADRCADLKAEIVSLLPEETLKRYHDQETTPPLLEQVRALDVDEDSYDDAVRVRDHLKRYGESIAAATESWRLSYGKRILQVVDSWAPLYRGRDWGSLLGTLEQAQARFTELGVNEEAVARRSYSPDMDSLDRLNPDVESIFKALGLVPETEPEFYREVFQAFTRTGYENRKVLKRVAEFERMPKERFTTFLRAVDGVAEPRLNTLSDRDRRILEAFYAPDAWPQGKYLRYIKAFLPYCHGDVDLLYRFREAGFEGCPAGLFTPDKVKDAFDRLASTELKARGGGETDAQTILDFLKLCKDRKIINREAISILWSARIVNENLYAHFLARLEALIPVWTHHTRNEAELLRAQDTAAEFLAGEGALLLAAQDFCKEDEEKWTCLKKARLFVGDNGIRLQDFSVRDRFGGGDEDDAKIASLPALLFEGREIPFKEVLEELYQRCKQNIPLFDMAVNKFLRALPFGRIQYNRYLEVTLKFTQIHGGDVGRMTECFRLLDLDNLPMGYKRSRLERIGDYPPDPENPPEDNCRDTAYRDPNRVWLNVVEANADFIGGDIERLKILKRVFLFDRVSRASSLGIWYEEIPYRTIMKGQYPSILPAFLECVRTLGTPTPAVLNALLNALIVYGPAVLESAQKCLLECPKLTAAELTWELLVEWIGSPDKRQKDSYRNGYEGLKKAKEQSEFTAQLQEFLKLYNDDPEAREKRLQKMTYIVRNFNYYWLERMCTYAKQSPEIGEMCLDAFFHYQAELDSTDFWYRDFDKLVEKSEGDVEKVQCIYELLGKLASEEKGESFTILIKVFAEKWDALTDSATFTFSLNFFAAHTDLIPSDSSTFNTLVGLAEVYQTDEAKFAYFAGFAKENGPAAIAAMKATKRIYKADAAELEKVERAILGLSPSVKSGGSNDGNERLWLLAHLEAWYTDYDSFSSCLAQVGGLAPAGAMFFIANKLAQKVKPQSFGTLVSIYAAEGNQHCKTLLGSAQLFNPATERLEACSTLLKENGPEALQCLVDSSEVYSNTGEFQEVVSSIRTVAEERGGSACKALGSAKYIFSKDRMLFDGFIAIVLEKGAEQTEQVIRAAEVYGRDLKRIQMTAEFFDAALSYDPVVLRSYIALCETESKARANEYIQGLSTQAKTLIGSGVPTGARALPEYDYLVKSVFPAGNYSSYEKNRACGDAMQHLARYHYKQEGYPVELSGLFGYQLKEGAQEDMPLLTSYTDRLQAIRQFVQSRGPDNGALQKDFDVKVDGLFDKFALDKFKGLSGLGPKDKLLALFIGEAYVRAKGVRPINTDILDLVVEYKYAYVENLEAYIVGTADAVKSYGDEVSQHRRTWGELSTVYGENVKHVLRHDIIEALSAESGSYSALLGVCDELFEVSTEEFSLPDKQVSRIRNTFENAHILDEDTLVEEKKKPGKYKVKPGRYKVLLSQVLNIFGTNIAFQGASEQDAFEKEVEVILEPCKGAMSMDNLMKLVPQLSLLRKRYRSQLNRHLENVFMLDYKTIDTEIDKYEEKLEVDMKQTSMDGPRNVEVRKAVKPRKIRGYFTKTQETANARMGAYLCLAGDQNMWNNEDYFELVMQDEETGQCVGVVMLLNIEAADGKKYLWFGPNPFEGFLDKVNSERCYDYMYRTTVQFAEENGYDGVVIPSDEGAILGQCTNRGGNFPELIKQSRLRDGGGKVIQVDFGASHELGKYGGSPYRYSSGALVWQKKAA